MMEEQAMTIAFTRILLPLARALREACLSHPRLRLKQPLKAGLVSLLYTLR